MLLGHRPADVHNRQQSKNERLQKSHKDVERYERRRDDERHHRGCGAGKALLRHLARIAVARGCGRFEWAVLDWNQPAIDFYQSFGARPQDEWTTYRLTGQALLDFAAG